MQNPRESPEAFARWVERREMQHRDFWLGSTLHYKSIGLYHRMADFARIESGDKWLNLGCGFCDLEIVVLRNTQPHIISVDNNPYMLKEAKTRLQQAGFPVNFSYDNELSISGESYSYTRIPKREPDFRLVDESVNVVFDDIRDFSLKESIKKTIDVVTFSLAGVSLAAVAQPPYKLDFKPRNYGETSGEELSRVHDVGLQIAYDAVKLAAQLLKPGGRLIYIDRYPINSDKQIDENTKIDLRNIPPTLRKEKYTSTVIQEPTGQHTAIIFDKDGVNREYSQLIFFEFRYQPKKHNKKKKKDRRRR